MTTEVGGDRLLIVHHTPSPAVHELVEACVAGAMIPELAGLQVSVEPALSATAADVLSSTGCVLITPANIGYMSGAMKHFFDTIYYPCLGVNPGRPYALVVHGNDDTTGAIRSVERIADALGWRRASSPLAVVGGADARDLQAARGLAATVAATLLT